MAEMKITKESNEYLEKCAFIQKSSLSLLACRRRNIESLLSVKISTLIREEELSSSSESDIIAILVSGPSKKVRRTVDYVDMLGPCASSKTMCYPLELERALGDGIWQQVFELAENVKLCKGPGTSVTIYGRDIAVVSRAVSVVEKLIKCSKLPSNESIDSAVNRNMEDLLKSDIPIILKKSLNALKTFPSPIVEVLMSWVRKAYDIPQKDAMDNSIITLDDSLLSTYSVSTNDSITDRNNNDDSVIVLDSPIPKTDVSVIVISDDDDDDTYGGETTRQSEEQTNAKKKMRVAGGSAKSVSVSNTRGERTTPPLFIPFEKRKSPCLPETSSSASAAPSPETSSSTPAVIPNNMAQRRLRPVVIDGSNVAREHGRVRNVFSCRGIQIAVDHFISRGHTDVVAFVPQFRRHKKKDTEDCEILERLHSKGQVVFVPSRRLDDKCVASYDDRFIVKLAHLNGGVILSNDNYRDLIEENPAWKSTIQERLIMFCFVGDILMIPDDPLGKNGPPLEELLTFPAEQPQQVSS